MINRIAMGLLSAAAFGVVILDASASHASTTSTAWSMNASSCTPTSSVIYTANMENVSAGSVAPATGTTGTITLYCPVSIDDNGGPGFNQLNITYTDPDGSTSNQYEVKAQLIQLRFSDGTLSFVSNVADSHDHVSTVHTTSALLTATPDFDNNYYYVRVDIIRTTGTAVPIFYGTWLNTQIAAP